MIFILILCHFVST